MSETTNQAMQMSFAVDKNGKRLEVVDAKARAAASENAGKISELTEEFDSLDATYSNYESVNIEFDNVVDGRIYSKSFPSGTTLANGRTYELFVEPGDKYLLSGKIIPANGYALCTYYNDEVYVTSVELYDGVTDTYTNYPITIPDGVTLLRCSRYNNAALTIKKIVPIDNMPLMPTKSEKKHFVQFDGTACYVKSHYNSGEDIVIKIAKPTTHGNGLPDFERVFTTIRSEPMDDSITANRTILSSSTDMFSPHIVKAANNADGDTPDNQYFTGGNHQTNNSGTGGSATATCTSWKVYVDGNELETGSVRADKVVMRWKNLIQAYNTTKSDGTGRAVMQEDIRLIFDGAKVYAEVTHTALEDIERTTYYGLQAVTRLFDTVRYMGSKSNRGENAVDESNDSGDKLCRDIIMANAYGDKLRVHIDSLDLGDFSESIREFSAYVTSSAKSYFAVIVGTSTSPFVQATGEQTMLSGYYDFYCD